MLVRKEINSVIYSDETNPSERDEFKQFRSLVLELNFIPSYREYTLEAGKRGLLKQPWQNIGSKYTIFADLVSDEFRNIPYSDKAKTRKTSLELLQRKYEELKVPLKLNMFRDNNFPELFKGRFEEMCERLKIPRAVNYLIPTRILDDAEKELDLTFIREAKFDWSKSVTSKGYYHYDALIKDSKILIEIDGESHYKPIYSESKYESIHTRDLIKDKLAKEHGYTLIRLSLPATYKDLVNILLKHGFKRRATFTENHENLLFGIKLVANKLGRIPSSFDYKRLQPDFYPPIPSYSLIKQRLGWKKAVDLCNFTDLIKSSQTLSYRDNPHLDALRTAYSYFKRSFTAKEYDDFVHSHPDLKLPLSGAITWYSTWRVALSQIGMKPVRPVKTLSDGDLSHYLYDFYVKTGHYPTRKSYDSYHLDGFPHYRAIEAYGTWGSMLNKQGLYLTSGPKFADGNFNNPYSFSVLKCYEELKHFPSEEEYTLFKNLHPRQYPSLQSILKISSWDLVEKDLQRFSKFIKRDFNSNLSETLHIEIINNTFSLKGKNFYIYDASKGTANLKAVSEKGYYILWQQWGLDKVVDIVRAKANLYSNKRLFARNLRFVRVDYSDSRLKHLLESSHVLGVSNSNFNFALEDLEGNLIQIIQFRRSSSNILLLTRNVTALNTIVIGGFTKIFVNAIKILREEHFKSIETFAIRDLTIKPEDSVYYRNHFASLGDVGSTLFYYSTKDIVNKEDTILLSKGLYPRNGFMKNKLSFLEVAIKLDGNYFVVDKSKTERSLLESLGVYQVLNSGCWKFVFNL